MLETIFVIIPYTISPGDETSVKGTFPAWRRFLTPDQADADLCDITGSTGGK